MAGIQTVAPALVLVVVLVARVVLMCLIIYTTIPTVRAKKAALERMRTRWRPLNGAMRAIT